jgi:hypothetical protein
MTRAATAKRSFIRAFCLLFPLLLILWVLLVLYPSPLRLVTSVQRLIDPGVDALAVEPAAAGLPDNPAAIEEAVLEGIPYSYDWQAYGMPWYFPTVREVLQKGEGDCKGRAIVLASVLEAKDIPYSLNTTPIHVWVDYEGKEETGVESQKASFYHLDPETGERSFGLPSIDPIEVFDTFWEGFWVPMPAVRKALLLAGVIGLTAARVIWSSEARRMRAARRGRGSPLPAPAACQGWSGEAGRGDP